MAYDISLVEMACEECGLEFSKVNENEMIIHIADGVKMVIANTDDGDTYWGFADAPWHTHDELLLAVGDSQYRCYMPEDLIVDWAKGQVLLVSLEREGRIIDRWLAHKNDCSDLKNIAPGEVMHFEAASNQAIQADASGAADL